MLSMYELMAAPRRPIRGMRSRARCGASSAPAVCARCSPANSSSTCCARHARWQRCAALVPAGGGRRGERAQIEAYSLSRLDDLAPLFDEVLCRGRAQGLPADTLMSEYAPGQFEITLRIARDALRAVDEAIAVQAPAERRGREARAASPVSWPSRSRARAGSGVHLHVSLAGRGGPQRVRRDDPAGSAAAPCHRRPERHAGREPAGVRAERQFYRRFRARATRRGAELGRQQSQRQPARAGGAAGVAACRTSHSGRGRESLCAAAAVLAGRGARHRRAPRSRGAGGRAMATRLPAATAGTAAAGHLARGDRARGRLGVPRRGARRRTSWRCSWPSSARNATGSWPRSRSWTTPGTCAPYDRRMTATIKDDLMALLDSQDANGGFSDEGFARLGELVEAIRAESPFPEPMRTLDKVEGRWEATFAHFGIKHSAGKTRVHDSTLALQSWNRFPAVADPRAAHLPGDLPAGQCLQQRHRLHLARRHRRGDDRRARRVPRRGRQCPALRGRFRAPRDPAPRRDLRGGTARGARPARRGSRWSPT